MTAPAHRNVLRWSCHACEGDGFHDRPDTVAALQDEMEKRSCPECGDDEYNPAVTVLTSLFAAMEDREELFFTGSVGDGPADALEGTEVGTAIAQNHPMMDPPEDPHTCVCDWCGEELEGGEMVTAYAFQHPGTDSPDTWVLFELFCSACDIHQLIAGSALTHDVMVHGFLQQHGAQFSVTDLAVLDESPVGDRIALH